MTPDEARMECLGYRCRIHGTHGNDGTCDCPDLLMMVRTKGGADIDAKIRKAAFRYVGNPLLVEDAERDGGYYRCPNHGPSREMCWCGAGEWMVIGRPPPIEPPPWWVDVAIGAAAKVGGAVGRMLAWVRG